ncbi:MAG: glycosyltransferase family 4 protein [Ignavibacteriae bacterium]|nr:glycosyltransferase family 1 protein [Ignavibacteriota bacterium]NOG99097.1 glycosyltransferase family 4 protein [Ignavibacteriota bacterium]
MKILVINYRFFISGGPERYMFNLIELLESKGHEVIPFSVKHEKNKSSCYSDFFLSSVGTGKEIYASEYRRGVIKYFFKIISRYFYSFEAKKKLNALINKKHPDIIYILNYKALISPSIIDVAKKFNIPVVHRLSDFGKICANNVLYDYNKNEICEKCITGTKLNGIVNKCVNQSFANSMMRVFANYAEKLINVNKKVDAFVITSQFSLRKFKEGSMPIDKMHHIPTFFPENKLIISNEVSNKHALYFGRVDYDKGVHVAIEAFKNINSDLYIIGKASDNSYLNYLKELICSNNLENIHLLGEKTFDELCKYLSTCMFVVVPSLWYDNLPNSVLEAYAYHKPVIASATGSLKMMVENKKTGLLFRRNDPADLRSKVLELLVDEIATKELGNNAYKKLLNEYGSDQHYNKLINLFESLLKN